MESKVGLEMDKNSNMIFQYSYKMNWLEHVSVEEDIHCVEIQQFAHRYDP